MSHQVLVHQHPALDGVLLQAGSANLDAGLIVSAEEVLHHDARREGEGARNRQVGALRQLIRLDQACSAGRDVQPFGGGQGRLIARLCRL